ncbi:MAG TPA: SDR family oxidoreductase [Aeromicrobium sp.]|nr:SDR family oxidoreductase [Aeromicrobium sp.]
MGLFRRRDLAGAKVFITGAASGIGKATALAVGAKGGELYLTDVNGVALEATVAEIEAAGGKVALARAADVSSFDAVQALAAEVHERVDAVDVVMNIAGISTWGRLDRLAHAQWQAIIDVNLMGPIHVLEAFVPPMMKARRGGAIVNVSSAAGIAGFPWHSAYSASKFGLRGVSEVLRFDLRRYGIDVCLVCPGAVNTGLVQTLNVAGVDTTGTSFTKLRDRFVGHAATPEKAAEQIVKGVERGTYWVYTSQDIRLLFLLQRYFEPGYRLLMRVMNDGFVRAIKKSERTGLPR